MFQMDDLPNEILRLILSYLNPRDLYQFASTSKKHASLTVSFWKPNTNPIFCLFRKSYLRYIEDKKNTMIIMLNNLNDILNRYPNKKIYKKYIKPSLFDYLLFVCKNEKWLLQMKSIQSYKQELEYSMNRFIHHPVLGENIQKYFECIYDNYDISFGLSGLFIYPQMEPTLSGL
jgi:hypothetical protein